MTVNIHYRERGKIKWKSVVNCASIVVDVVPPKKKRKPKGKR